MAYGQVCGCKRLFQLSLELISLDSASELPGNSDADANVGLVGTDVLRPSKSIQNQQAVLGRAAVTVHTLEVSSARESLFANRSVSHDLGRQAGSAARSAALQELATSSSGHTVAESVLLGTPTTIRLKSSLHNLRKYSWNNKSSVEVGIVWGNVGITPGNGDGIVPIVGKCRVDWGQPGPLQ